MNKIKLLTVVMSFTLLLSGCSSSNTISLEDKMLDKILSIQVDSQWTKDEALTKSIGFVSYVNNEKCILTDKTNQNGTEISFESESKLSDRQISEIMFSGYQTGTKNYELKIGDNTQQIEFSTLTTKDYPYQFISGKSWSVSASRFSLNNNGLLTSVQVEIHCPSSVSLNTDLLNTFKLISR